MEVTAVNRAFSQPKPVSTKANTSANRAFSIRPSDLFRASVFGIRI
jgi:hypothetical protein